MSSQVSPVKIKKTENGNFSMQDDLVAVEEPLEIRIGYGPLGNREQKSVSVTMRTPGNDFELASGFLFSEGIINSLEDLESVKYCEDLGKEEERGNVVRVELKPKVKIDFQLLERHFYTNSSCGVCGKTSIESVFAMNCPVINPREPEVDKKLITGLTHSLAENQLVFKHTGGLHAVALYNIADGSFLVREDIGRHNALDKIIGTALNMNLIPLKNHIALLSGRTGFELVQKAVVAGIPIIASVGAPSSLAIKTAKSFEVTLIGFLRDKNFNIYCGEQRILA